MVVIRVTRAIKAPGLGGLTLLAILMVSGSVSALPGEDEGEVLNDRFLQSSEPPSPQNTLRRTRQRSTSLLVREGSVRRTRQRARSLVYRLPEKEDSRPLTPLQSLENAYGFFRDILKNPKG